MYFSNTDAAVYQDIHFLNISLKITYKKSEMSEPGLSVETETYEPGSI